MRTLITFESLKSGTDKQFIKEMDKRRLLLDLSTLPVDESSGVRTAKSKPRAKVTVDSNAVNSILNGLISKKEKQEKLDERKKSNDQAIDRLLGMMEQDQKIDKILESDDESSISLNSDSEDLITSRQSDSITIRTEVEPICFEESADIDLKPIIGKPVTIDDSAEDE